MKSFLRIGAGVAVALAIGCQEQTINQPQSESTAGQQAGGQLAAGGPFRTADHGAHPEQSDRTSGDHQDNKAESLESVTAPEITNGLLSKASQLLKKAADAGSQEADAANKWLNERLEDVGSTGADVAGDVAQWANDMFESLKDQGLTTAANTSQWITEDIRNINALKYKIVKVSLDDLSAVEKQLNSLGELKWDCFHAVEKGGETILFFKKERRSFLKNIPFRDLMKLVPLMGSENSGS
jgi:hypothetical protein